VTGPETSPQGGSPIEWDSDGAPRSRRFGDIYFSREDGLAESRAVFLDGCGLPEAWIGRSSFVVGELGFGTGLNIAALLELWRRARAPGQRLHVFSVEAFPISSEEARRALAAFPEIAEAADVLTGAWPSPARGFHRIDLPWGATLDLAVMGAGEALAEWDGRADAWFLDGFAPAVNPQMWRDEVLALVAARSRPGARAATFTVAGQVRRGLQAAGFEVAKRPGHGRKRERLEAVLAGGPAPPAASPRVAIIGGGVAGAALARAFAALGVRPTLIEAKGLGAGASGNPAALVMPRLDAGGGDMAKLHAQAFARAVDLYRREIPDAVIAQGALQLEAAERDARRFDVIAQSDLFAPDTLQRLTPAEASARLGEASDVGGLWLSEALVVEPAGATQIWSADAELVQGDVAEIAAATAGWRLLDGQGREIAVADVVCVAAGPAAADLTGLPLRPVRGQVTWAETGERPAPAAWGGDLAPTRTGLVFGATHDRDDAGADVRRGDQARNLATLAVRRPALAARLEGATLRDRASVRAAGPRQAPLAGEVPGRTGVLVLAGLGGRGFTLAPLLAEHLAARALGAPSPLPARLAAHIDPGHFADSRKGAGSAPGRRRHPGNEP